MSQGSCRLFGNMNESHAIDRVRQVIRRQQKDLATEDTYDRVESSLNEDLERFGRMAC